MIIKNKRSFILLLCFLVLIFLTSVVDLPAESGFINELTSSTVIDNPETTVLEKDSKTDDNEDANDKESIDESDANDMSEMEDANDEGEEAIVKDDQNESDNVEDDKNAFDKSDDSNSLTGIIRFPNTDKIEEEFEKAVEYPDEDPSLNERRADEEIWIEPWVKPDLKWRESEEDDDTEEKVAIDTEDDEDKVDLDELTGGYIDFEKLREEERKRKLEEEKKKKGIDENEDESDPEDFDDEESDDLDEMENDELDLDENEEKLSDDLKEKKDKDDDKQKKEEKKKKPERLKLNFRKAAMRKLKEDIYDAFTLAEVDVEKFRASIKVMLNKVKAKGDSWISNSKRVYLTDYRYRDFMFEIVPYFTNRDWKIEKLGGASTFDKGRKLLILLLGVDVINGNAIKLDEREYSAVQRYFKHREMELHYLPETDWKSEYPSVNAEASIQINRKMPLYPEVVDSKTTVRKKEEKYRSLEEKTDEEMERRRKERREKALVKRNNEKEKKEERKNNQIQIKEKRNIEPKIERKPKSFIRKK